MLLNLFRLPFGLSRYFRLKIIRKIRKLNSYQRILETHFDYYNELPRLQQREFLKRLYEFRKTKKFHFVEQDQSEEIIVLVSAAAIQISFGLSKYCFSYFKDIYVMKDAYTFGLSTVAWAGHVTSLGIYISWNHFVQGYSLKNDRNNVALHEMAHALEYEIDRGDLSHDIAMIKKFNDILKQITSLLILDKQMPSGLYSDEALQNSHEFWANSIELFFENPSDLCAAYPAFYDAITNLLNQDPRYRPALIHTPSYKEAAQ